MAHRLLRTYWQIANQHLSFTFLKCIDNVHRLNVSRAKSQIVRIIRHVSRHAIEDRSHLHHDPGDRQDLLENQCTIRFGKDGFFYWLANLTAIDVKRSHNFNVADPPLANLGVHEAGIFICFTTFVKFKTLYEGTGTVTNTNNGYLNHFRFSS